MVLRGLVGLFSRSLLTLVHTPGGPARRLEALESDNFDLMLRLSDFIDAHFDDDEGLVGLFCLYSRSLLPLY